MSKLKPSGNVSGPCRILNGHTAAIPHQVRQEGCFYGYILMIDERENRFPITVPIGRQWADGRVDWAAWTEEWLKGPMTRMAMDWNALYGTAHYYRLYPEKRQPGGVFGAAAREKAVAAILAGPDCAGRRFLQSIQSKGFATTIADATALPKSVIDLPSSANPE